MKTVRFLVMCLLALAMPLQGMAAVTQMFCHGNGSDNSHGIASSVVQTTVDHSHQHATDRFHDQSQASDYQASEHQASDHQASKAEVVKSLNHKCSTCAQCCIGTALLPTPIHLVLSQQASTFVATNVVLLGEFSPHSLERPPRSFLV